MRSISRINHLLNSRRLHFFIIFSVSAYDMKVYLIFGGGEEEKLLFLSYLRAVIFSHIFTLKILQPRLKTPAPPTCYRSLQHLGLRNYYSTP